MISEQVQIFHIICEKNGDIVRIKGEKYMKKQIINILCAFGIMSLFMPTASAEDVTYITNEAELRAISNNLSGSYALANDISVTGEWTPIGEDRSNPFTGTFDGCGYSISGLTVTDSKLKYVGLFGAAKDAVIHNLSIKDCDISTDVTGNEYYIGAITAYNEGGAITDCTVTGEVDMTLRSSSFLWGIPLTMTDAYCGSITGYNTGDIERCSVGTHVSVHSDYYAAFGGGIAGFSTDKGRISECQFQGGVAAYSFTGVTHGGAGGITSHNNGTIENCCVKAYIASNGNYVHSGGITSRNNGKIFNSFYCGTVRSTIMWQLFPESSTGNMASENNGTIENCYYVAAVGSSSESTGNGESGNACSIPESSADNKEMYPSLDFESIWKIGDDGKPELKNVRYVEIPTVVVPGEETTDVYFSIELNNDNNRKTVITVMGNGSFHLMNGDTGESVEILPGMVPQIESGEYILWQ